MPPQVVAVAEGLVAVATDERRFAFGFFLHYRHGWSNATTTTMAPSATRPTTHAVLEEVRAHWGLLVQRDRHDRFLVLRLIAGIEQRQQAVRAHLVLVVQSIIGLLKAKNKKSRDR